MPKTFCHSEVSRHNGPKSLWVVIHNDIFDLTKFANEHPGGAGPLLDFSGRDATQAFELAGHSDGARSMMCKYKIGTLPASERTSHHQVCKLKWLMLALAAAIVIGIVVKKYQT